LQPIWNIWDLRKR